MIIKNLLNNLSEQVFCPGIVLREKYEAFKTLLQNDKRAHELMAELDASFAGQYRTILKISQAQLLEAYKSVLASKYSPRALYYRIS